MPPRRRPATTAEAGIPGAFAGETVTRRRFMTGSAHAAGAIATSAILLPAIGFAIGPVFERQRIRWQPLGPLAAIPHGTYETRVVTESPGIGEAGKTTVLV